MLLNICRRAIVTLAGLCVLVTTPALADEVRFVRYLSDGELTEVTTDGPGTTQSTPFGIASVGKAVTAVAVLRLVGRGELQLDDPVAQFVPPEVTDGLGGLNGVTVRHLLTMTSGLPDYLNDAFEVVVYARPQDISSAFVALSYAYGEAALFAPGTDYDYSNTNYALLGVILESVTGQSYAEVMEQEVLRPAGMSDTFVFGSRPFPPDFPDGIEDGVSIHEYYSNMGLGDGGLISTAPDLAQFYRALFIDRSLLAERELREMLHDPIGIGYGMGVDVEADGLHLGHSGGDVGFTSDVRLDMVTGRIAVELISSYYVDADWPREVLDFGLLNPCPYPGDGDCDEPNGLGVCEWRTDTADCSDPNSNFGSGSGFAGALSGTAAQD